MKQYKEQMSLGDLIDALERLPKEASVYFDFANFSPYTFHSYRGNYEDIALAYNEGGLAPTVGDVLERCRIADGSIFSGWKGGTYRMDRDTPVWVASVGESTDTVITSVTAQNDYTVILNTTKISGGW